MMLFSGASTFFIHSLASLSVCCLDTSTKCAVVAAVVIAVVVVFVVVLFAGFYGCYNFMNHSL